mmetsp:Transcript_5794/g.17308  ORF Transcript_5794/g.17308 Transcript_5794/m.17308 type:complete len:621 (-) Transcript_5794:1537-3399(-)|eukprot:CAMPEP_0198730866 /NCGR_PEP_ID=MMETSP1475-20131203/26770_1 /TAXON_ID= ORGANISM="Unidentified sp., Strain CCMP1999" /NCGR_SAMPLE_ID=MMETSP1475 /ASSEMBLY_ACC=CAM_ASM_001111 /LENGTH=620 /DNA_ID=CAMNT_0044493735 /DNA_START=99 /DNA_END=1961 /DNA_ORIENTATION=+
MSSVMEDDDEAHTALYQVLNLPKDASEEQIKSAYRRLCQTCHPDKHTDPEKKAAATVSFTKLKDAYEVLSDPLKRKVYDEFGLDGVRSLMAEGLELSVWEDVKARFQKDGVHSSSARQKATERDSVLTVHNQVKVNVDGTGLTSLLEEFDGSYSGNMFIVTQSMLATNATAYVSNKDTIAASYGIVTRGLSKPAGATMSLTGRRTFDADTFAEVSYIYGVSGRKSTRTVATKLWRKLSERSSSMLEVTYGINEDALNLVLSIVRQLSNRWTGQLAWIAGAQRGVMCTFRHSPSHDGGGLVDDDAALENKHAATLMQRVKRFFRTMVFNFSARLGSYDTSLSASIQKGLGSSWQDAGASGGYTKLRCKVGIGTWDCELSGGRNFVDWQSSFGLGVALSHDGVLLRVKVSRGGHKFSVPLLLASTSRPLYASFVASFSIAVAAVVQSYIVRPIKKAQLKQMKDEARQLRKVVIEKAREEAESALALMRITVERSRERESAISEGGLIITRALFGSAQAVSRATVDTDVTGREIELEMVDATDALQYLVEDSKVMLYSSSKSSLMGIWDPAALEEDERALRVWYQFRHHPHECSIDNFDPLEIPQKAHRLDNGSSSLPSQDDC